MAFQLWNWFVYSLISNWGNETDFYGQWEPAICQNSDSQGNPLLECSLKCIQHTCMQCIEMQRLQYHVLTTYKCSTSTAEPSGRASWRWCSTDVPKQPSACTVWTSMCHWPNKFVMYTRPVELPSIDKMQNMPFREKPHGEASRWLRPCVHQMGECDPWQTAGNPTLRVRTKEDGL